MNHATYRFRHDRPDPHAVSFREVKRVADEVVASGRCLETLLSEYGAFVEETGHEKRRSEGEYLVEALMLGVLWRARGHEAMQAHRLQPELLEEILVERRLGMPRRRDGSTAKLLATGWPAHPGWSSPQPTELRKLYDWLWATGEYDDEIERLVGWLAFLEGQPGRARERIRRLMEFAIAFERMSDARLGRGTLRVEQFLGWVLPLRPVREDTVQCSRRRIEYHFNMVGADLLNRAWRRDFQACSRHVLVLPGCARALPDPMCKARREETELHCTHCSKGCTVSRATRVAEKAGATAIAVLHGSDFGRFLRSPRLSGGDVAIVGVACVPGLVGAGWRARNRGLPAQCVLLDFSGCTHWLDEAKPTTLDLDDLNRALECYRPAKVAEACAA
jgi:uncharacterized protein